MPRRGMLRFMGADADFDEAEFVIVGVPFDRTTSFRSGTKFGPNAIREASWNFEFENFEHGVSLANVKLHDAGNLDEEGSADDMVTAVEVEAKRIVGAGKFPIFVGGEHSISPPVVKAFGPISAIQIDAHLDFREKYQGQKNSHGCAHKRIEDVVGKGNVFAFGIRSIGGEEQMDQALFADAFEIHEKGCEKTFERMLKKLKRAPVYLTLDIDGIDPAYAPGTGTPEPFGLTPFDVRYIINRLGDRLVGFDVVEVSPPYDNGNTAVLAARMIREVIAVRFKSSRRKS